MLHHVLILFSCFSLRQKLLVTIPRERSESPYRATRGINHSCVSLLTLEITKDPYRAQRARVALARVTLARVKSFMCVLNQKFRPQPQPHLMGFQIGEWVDSSQLPNRMSHELLGSRLRNSK